MLKLYGFPLSNYYNRVKIVLLEKNVPFEEVLAVPGKDEVVKTLSPARKIPFLELENGEILCESGAIFEYLEECYPITPLLPEPLVARARVRELATVMDLYLELPARRLYAEAFFGGKVSDETKQEVERELRRGVQAFERLARFSPYIAGNTFTYADITAAVHLPVVSIATAKIYGKDVLEPFADRIKPYLKMLNERPAIARTNADRKAAQAK
ncbi:MAG: glutathione S-transferase [Pseudomonadota bacterium]|nr:MAG: glutathione S-transferase [Pseudomonadota bacterium]